MAAKVEDSMNSARAELMDAKAQLTREIRNYPTPIAGCDCQFNHLLAQRTKITAALKALDSEI